MVWSQEDGIVGIQSLLHQYVMLETSNWYAVKRWGKERALEKQNNVSKKNIARPDPCQAEHPQTTQRRTNFRHFNFTQASTLRLKANGYCLIEKQTRHAPQPLSADGCPFMTL